MPLTRKEITELERGVREVFRSTMGWGARMATYYINDRLIVRATRRMAPDGRAKRVEMVLTYGAPNFVERRFIRLCKQAGEPLPVRRVQVKWWPKKRRAS